MRSRSPIKSMCDLLTETMSLKEFLVWFALAAALVGFRLATLGPNLEPDSYQYLSVAGNFAMGRPGYTSIVHFDSERAHGTVPAPMTTFPPGYSATMAALDATGLQPASSGALISAAAFLALFWLYRGVGSAIGLGGLGSRMLLLLTLANSEALLFSRSVLSESLFTLLTAGAVIAFVAGAEPGDQDDVRWPWLLAGGLLIGCAYWIRYAGLFLLAAMVFGSILLFLRRRHAVLPVAASLGLAAAMVALGFLRNLALAGNWRGGNEKVVHHPLLGVLLRAPVEIFHLFGGRIGSAHYGLPDLLLVAGLATTAGACAWALVKGRGPAPAATFALLKWAACGILVYCAAMVYAGHVSVISFGPRMFLPMLPLFLLCLAILVDLAHRRLAAGGRRFLVVAVAVMACAYVAVNVRSIRSQPATPAPDQLVRAALGAETAPGQTLGAWIDANIPAGQVIVATHGQATGYVLQRPTLSLVPQEYSSRLWDEAEVRTTMQRFHARYLIVYPGDDPELYGSPFLAGLPAGTHPAWLVPAALAQGVRIFRSEPTP